MSKQNYWLIGMVLVAGIIQNIFIPYAYSPEVLPNAQPKSNEYEIVTKEYAILKEKLKHYTPEQRNYFLKQLTIQGYQDLIDNYNEYEWKRLIISLTPHEQSYWPQTIQEQQVALEAIYCKIYKRKSTSPTIELIVGIKKLFSSSKPCYVQTKPVIDTTMQKLFTNYMHDAFKVKS